MDIDERHQPDTLGSFLDLPRLFRPSSFEVIVFDPPHLTEAGNGIVGAGGWAETYGTQAEGLDGASISGWFLPFLQGARAVLVSGGIVLAKISNQVHRGAFRWQADEFRAAARALGMTPCDEIVKVRDSAITDPRWRTCRHVRKTHCFWIVVRNDSRCARRTSSSPRGHRASVPGDVSHCPLTRAS